VKLKSIGAILVFSFFSFYLQTSCTKITSTEVGKDLIPAIDNIHTFDTTIEVLANNYIFADSSFPRMGGSLQNVPDYALGYVSNDPQFGTVTGTIFMEMKPPLFPYTFGASKDSLSLDSVVLCLSFVTNYGDTNTQQKVDVYALDGPIRADSSYRTDTYFEFSELLGSKTFAPKELDDSVKLFKDSLSHQLRIRLNDEFGTSLLSQDSSGAYKSDSAFRAFFKGFAIVPDQATTAGLGGNALSYFALPGAKTYLKLYYKQKLADGKTDTTFAVFTFFAQFDGHVNNISQFHTGSQLAAHTVNVPDGDSLVYIQTTPGSYSKILTPAVKAFRDLKGNVVINRAELSMQQIFTPGENDDIFAAPNYLYIDAFDTSGGFRPIPLDFTFSGSGVPSDGVFGGASKLVDDGNGHVVSKYTFVLSRYLQNIVTRNSPIYDLRLWAPFGVTYPGTLISFGLNRISYGRVKLGGGKHSTYPMKLRIIYSKI